MDGKGISWARALCLFLAAHICDRTDLYASFVNRINPRKGQLTCQERFSDTLMPAEVATQYQHPCLLVQETLKVRSLEGNVISKWVCMVCLFWRTAPKWLRFSFWRIATEQDRPKLVRHMYTSPSRPSKVQTEAPPDPGMRHVWCVQTNLRPAARDVPKPKAPKPNG